MGDIEPQSLEYRASEPGRKGIKNIITVSVLLIVLAILVAVPWLIHIATEESINEYKTWPNGSASGPSSIPAP